MFAYIYYKIQVENDPGANRNRNERTQGAKQDSGLNDLDSVIMHLHKKKAGYFFV